MFKGIITVLTLCIPPAESSKQEPGGGEEEGGGGGEKEGERKGHCAQ